MLSSFNNVLNAIIFAFSLNVTPRYLSSACSNAICFDRHFVYLISLQACGVVSMPIIFWMVFRGLCGWSMIAASALVVSDCQTLSNWFASKIRCKYIIFRTSTVVFRPSTSSLRSIVDFIILSISIDPCILSLFFCSQPLAYQFFYQSFLPFFLE